MNTKSILLAAMIAAATGSAFAAEYTATATNPEVQIAQVTTRGQVSAPTAVASRVAPVAKFGAAAKDESFGLPATKADTRTRAQARAEAAAYNMSAEARADRISTLGGQQ